MPILKRLFSFYIFSNIHVSIAVFCLTKISLFTYGVSDNTIPYFTMLSTLVSYNFIRYYQKDELNKLVSNFIKKNEKGLIVLSMIGLVLLVKLVFKLKFNDFLILIPFVLATAFYIIPFSKSRMNLRSVSSLKLFLISFSWAGTTVLLPLIHHEINFSFNSWLLFIQRFLLVIALTIPFDLRDVNYDKPEIKTLPQSIGIGKSKILGTFALVLFFILEIFREADRNDLLITLIISILSFLFLIFAKSDQKKYYSSFWVESIPIFWYLILFIRAF